jgi:hypothetical protein
VEPNIGRHLAYSDVRWDKDYGPNVISCHTYATNACNNDGMDQACVSRLTVTCMPDGMRHVKVCTSMPDGYHSISMEY